MPQAKPHPRRPWQESKFRVLTLVAPVDIPKERIPTHWIWHIESSYFAVALAIEAHLLAEQATVDGTIAAMHRMSLMPVTHTKRRPQRAAPFFEFQPDDYLMGRFELPEQVMRAEIRLMYISDHAPKLIVERVETDE